MASRAPPMMLGMQSNDQGPDRCDQSAGTELSTVVSFELAPTCRDETQGKNRGSSEFDDFVIGGRTLSDRLDEALAAGEPDIVPGTPLHDDVPVCSLNFDLRDEVERLMGFAPGEVGDRARLLVCALCAHPGCGSLTARVDFDDSTVVWRDFAWEEDDGPLTDESRVLGLGPFRFDRPSYTAALLDFVEQWPARTGWADDRAEEAQRRVELERAQFRSERRRQLWARPLRSLMRRL